VNRLAFAEHDVAALRTHLAAAEPLEGGAFFLLRSAPTTTGFRLVASTPYLPGPNEWDAQERHRLTPSARLLSAIVSRASSAKAGLLFVHSHPDTRHPTAFSLTDFAALDALAPTLADLIDGPIAAGVVGPNGWVATLRQGDVWVSIERIATTGRTLSFLEPSQPIRPSSLDDRQQAALGDLNGRLANCDVAIVGTGGVGSPLAEAVVRMGVRTVTLIDHDRLDTPSNLRRVFGARLRDLTDPPAWKAQVVGEHCRNIGLPTEVRILPGDIRTFAALPDVLDSDVVLCATDSHSSRAALTAIAYAFNIPLIDAGVRVGRGARGLEGLPAEVRITGPGLPCLWCRKTLSSTRVREENLPEGQRQRLEAEGYILGEGGPAPSVAALTVLAAGLVACALLGVIDEDGDRLPSAYLVDGLFGDSYRVEQQAAPRCICHRCEGLGLAAPLGLR
jgi:molybdopterin/thiamine biosynthesis adenylyltransferase